MLACACFILTTFGTPACFPHLTLYVQEHVRMLVRNKYVTKKTTTKDMRSLSGERYSFIPEYCCARIGALYAVVHASALSMLLQMKDTSAVQKSKLFTQFVRVYVNFASTKHIFHSPRKLSVSVCVYVCARVHMCVCVCACVRPCA
jgi:hypothetical protein